MVPSAISIPAYVMSSTSHNKLLMGTCLDTSTLPVAVSYEVTCGDDGAEQIQPAHLGLRPSCMVGMD
jgi:hypothetical protein